MSKYLCRPARCWSAFRRPPATPWTLPACAACWPAGSTPCLGASCRQVAARRSVIGAPCSRARGRRCGTQATNRVLPRFHRVAGAFWSTPLTGVAEEVGTPACPGVEWACAPYAQLTAFSHVGKVGLGNRYGLDFLLDECSRMAREEQRVGPAGCAVQACCFGTLLTERWGEPGHVNVLLACHCLAGVTWNPQLTGHGAQDGQRLGYLRLNTASCPCGLASMVWETDPCSAAWHWAVPN